MNGCWQIGNITFHQSTEDKNLWATVWVDVDQSTWKATFARKRRETFGVEP